MLAATILVVILLSAAFGFQAVWCGRFLAIFQKPTSPAVQDRDLPKVAVVMPLRGADPFLERTLLGVGQLNYPQYDIRIVVDHREDPAWDLVHRIVGAQGCENVRIEELAERRTTCSLKMSALIQAIAGLDESYGVVVIIDGDVVTYPDWLRDLVAPLADPEIGVTTGVRWFSPERTNAGSLVRYIWNSAAVAQMHAFEIGFGGSLAVRTSLLRDADILEKWSRIMFEDTFTVNEVHSLGSKLKFVPEATMINRESIDVPACTRFISRQILNARMYHRSWPAIAAYSLTSALALNGAMAAGAAALLLGRTAEAAAIGIALAAYAAGMGFLLIWSEVVVRRVVQKRGEQIPGISWKLLGAILLTHYVYLTSVIMALRVKEVEWRGIRYSLAGPRKVRLVHYSPYCARLTPQDARASL